MHVHEHGLRKQLLVLQYVLELTDATHVFVTNVTVDGEPVLRLVTRHRLLSHNGATSRTLRHAGE